MLRFVPAATDLMAAWWGFAEADRTVLGLVVAVLAAVAVAYVLVRIGRSRAARRPTRRT